VSASLQARNDGQRRKDSLFCQIRNDTQPREKGLLRRIETGCGQAVRQSFPLKINRSECESGRHRDGGLDESFAFPSLGRRMIDFENAQSAPKGIAIGVGVKTRAEDYQLTDTARDSSSQSILGKARSNGDEEAEFSFQRIVARGLDSRFGVRAKNPNGQRIRENGAAFQHLMGRAVNGCAPRGAARLALLHGRRLTAVFDSVNRPANICIASPAVFFNVSAMRFVQTISAMRRHATQWHAQRIAVAFVPTMGFLHEGHVSLIKRARRAVGRKGKVAVSLYVNPTQFAPNEDLAAYPRDLARDKKLCAKAGVDVLFAPSDREMYPEAFSTYVAEERLSQSMEGTARPEHFRGVTTVLAKLFHIVQPSVAIFGAKDFQQAAVVRKMAEDLNFPLKIIVAPTVRELGGLAMSSRNQYLTPDQRQQAVILWHAMQRARRAVAAATSIPAARLQKELRALIATQPQCRVDYIEFFDPQTLAPVERVKRGTQIALAVFVGKTRLIDNGKM
jgi:pantoate--beta-alanine ligase